MHDLAPVIAVHSFHRGTGKSHLAANLAALLVRRGLRVGLVDTSLQFPALHLLLRLPAEHAALPDFATCLLERVACIAAVRDVTGGLGLDAHGRLFVLPSSTSSTRLRQALQQGYHLDWLAHGLHDLTHALALDALILDTDAGVQPETLTVLALCDTLLAVLRLDQQDYQGTGVLLDVARQLAVQRSLLVVNQAPGCYPNSTVIAQVQQSFGCEVALVLPHLDELAALASRDLFVLCYPHHPATTALVELARQLP